MPFRPQDPTLKPLLVYIDAGVRQRLKIKAARTGTTVTEIVRRALAREAKGIRK